MADKTLIQGARELAASKATSGIGAAMSAGFSGVQERAAARNAELAKQGRKEAEAIQARTAKLMGGWKGLNINEGEFSQAQLVEIDKTLINIKDDFSDASTALGKDPANLDLIEKRKGYMREMVSYRSALDNYADRSEAWKNPPAKNSKYSDSEANVSNLALNERAYTSPVIWNREQQGLFIPGKEGGEATSFGAMAMPFYLPEGVLSGIASEAGKLSAARKSELTKTQLDAYEIKLKDTIGAKNPNEGINNAPALLANDDFRLLFPELNDIVYTEENSDAIVQEMADVIMSRYKFIASSATEKSNSGAASNVVKPNLVATVSEMQAFEKEILTNQFTGPRETRSWSLGGSNNPEQLKIKYDPGTNKWTYLNAKKVSERRVADSLSELMTELPRLFYK